MNRKRMFKLTLVLVASIGILLVLVNCFMFNTRANDKNLGADNKFRTETQPIVNRFPQLGNVEKTYWKADYFGSSQDVGLSSYWMIGYVYLDNEIMERYKTSYTWTDPILFKPSLNLNFEQEKEPHWMSSDDFDNYIIPVEFMGHFYFDINNGVFYFEVESM